jgi:hypothetical protein
VQGVTLDRNRAAFQALPPSTARPLSKKFTIVLPRLEAAPLRFGVKIKRIVAHAS